MELPSIKPQYSDAFRDTLTGAVRYAAHMGVGKKYLALASPEYTDSADENYGIHKFSTFYLDAEGFDRSMISYDDQLNNVRALLNDGVLWCDPPSLIVINSPHYFFNSSAKNPYSGAEGFLAHLLCSLAYRIIKHKKPNTKVNFLETMQLDLAKGYSLEERHLLIWGVCNDLFNDFECNKTIQFLHSFRHHTRILLTSTTDIGALLKRFLVAPSHVSFIFELESGATKSILPLVEAKKTKKPKAPKPIKEKPQKVAVSI